VSGEENAGLVRLSEEILETASALFAALQLDCIDAFKDRFGVEPICRLPAGHGMAIAPSTCYARRGAQRVCQADPDDARMTDRLMGIAGILGAIRGKRRTVTTRRRTDVGFMSTGLVSNSDAGSQYRSLALTEVLIDAGITGSIGSVDDALDNGLMESSLGLYKTEAVGHNPHSWTGLRDVEAASA